ncbi:MAG: cell division protein ZipA C-terminal FtsZ-binding domain-containing protein, partial [Pseudomonadota bacterium]
VAGGVITLLLVYGSYFFGGRRRRSFADPQDAALKSLEDTTTLSNATVDPALIERAMHQRDASRQPTPRAAAVASELTEPALDYAQDDPDFADVDADNTLAWRQDEVSEVLPVAGEEPSLTVINVMARPGQVLSGVALANAFEARGFELGDLGLYHFNHDHGCIFSIVNMVEPGQFDPAQLHKLTTPGVCFFLQLPGPLRDDVAYDMMVAEAYEVSKAVGADLRDDNHAPVTRTHLEETRARLIRSANARFGDSGGQLIT